MVGAIGYLQELLELAAACGEPELIKSLGAISTRSKLLNAASMADVGISLMPMRAGDVESPVYGGCFQQAI